MTDTEQDVRIPIVNDRIGNLRVLGTIASGGMAIVYKVVHEELEVVRAIKMLKPGCKKENRQRLLTEAKIAAHLHHPNIVQIYDVSLWNDSAPYIEMEYVDGTSLFDLLAEREKLPFVVAAAIASIVCRALDFAAHQKISVYGKKYHGLVHRDIKPANILLSSTGVVKLADFGIALPGNESIHTTDQTLMGTAPYISPEQIDGEKLDPRCDIYSLGAVLYETIAGVKPFPQKKMTDLLKCKLKGTYEPIQSLVPDLPTSLVDAAAKSLMADREYRYGDAAEFGDAIDAVLAEVTDANPASILKDYIESKGALSIDPRFTRHAKTANARFVVLCGIALAAIAFCLSGVIWISSSLSKHGRGIVEDKMADRRWHNSLDSILWRAGDNSRAVTASPGAAVNGRPGNAAAPTAQHKTPAAVSPQAASSPTHGVTTRESGTAKSASLQSGLRAFAAGRYDEAAGLLRKALADGLDERTAATARLRLIESYVKQRDYAEALDVAAQTTVDDGYYHLLRAQSQFGLGAYDKSEDALVKAQSTPSTDDPGIRRDVAYWWALNRHAMYAKKPNKENAANARQAWEAFKRYCAGASSSTQCREAREKSGELPGE